MSRLRTMHTRSILAIAATFALVTLVAPAAAHIPTCELHNGMHIWYLDYAESDYTLAHPLGVREGVVEINERAWHARCAKDTPTSKIFVPFTSVHGKGIDASDSRFPQGVWKTRAAALDAYRRLR